ncbi:hypothetical protein SB822_01185 [Paraburkholderia sp. SIMBA_054]
MLLRIVVFGIALSAVTYTKTAHHVFVHVTEPSFCQSAITERSYQLADNSCVYQNADVRGNWLYRTFEIGGEAGGKLIARDASIVDADVSLVHKTWLTWLMWAVAGTMLFSAVRAIFQGVRADRDPALSAYTAAASNAKKTCSSRNQFVATLLALAVADLYFAPVLYGAYADVRIALHESSVVPNSPETDGVLVRRSADTGFYRLGTSTYDRLLHMSGVGCRAYDTSGAPLALDAYEADRPIPPMALPRSARFVGTCIAPEYVPTSS